MRICGMDEVGRGALAGPLTAAAVIINHQETRNKLKDSKQLNSKQRNRLYKKIIKHAEIVEIETISTRKINNRGMGWANKEIFKKLIKRTNADKFIIDGNLKISVQRLASSVQGVVKADTKVPEVMAASIVAKVTRDKLMKELHKKHPNYGWKTNVGYGTRYHIRAIREFGMLRYHRSVFVTSALRNGSRSDHE